MKPTGEQLHEIATITLHPGWQVLTDHVERVGEKMTESMARRILAGSVPTELEVAYLRGYRAGCQDTLSSPQKALASLKKLAAGGPEE